MALSKTEKLILSTLAGKPFWRPEMGPVLARVLDRECVSDEHRSRVCEKAVTMRFGDPDRPEDRCPGPAELAELCGEVSPVVMQEAKADCAFCGGAGFEVIGNGARRCRCGGFPLVSGRRYSEPEGSATRESVSEDSEMRELVFAVSERRKLV